MMRRKACIMGNLKEILDNHDNSLTDEERRILTEAYNSLHNGMDVNRCVFKLKTQLSELSLRKGLSPEALSYFSELSRQEPSTSVSSMWNFLVRKPKQ